jgi:exosortase
LGLSTADQHGQLLRRHLYFLFFLLGSFFVFWVPLRSLIRFSLTRDYGSHILLIAPMSAYLIYLKRREVFSKPQFSFFAGLSLFLAGAILEWAAHLRSRVDNDYFSIEILALIVLWMSGFILSYGTHAFRAARFPWLFLLLLVPIPDFLIDRVISFLQAGSATVAGWLFRLFKVPVWREGFVLRLPTLELEVAKECSGIRSSIVLLITTLVVGEFVLRSGWRKSVLVLSIIPVVILKNGTRIVTIALLTMYVSRRFLHGWLHRSGGIVFYLLGLLTLLPILILLKRSETRGAKHSPRMPALLGTNQPGGARELGSGKSKLQL